MQIVLRKTRERHFRQRQRCDIPLRLEKASEVSQTYWNRQGQMKNLAH